MNEMFMRLFKYIVGVNEGTDEIDMTRPVITKMSPQKRTGHYDEEMCFWLGPKYNRRTPPRPLDRQVQITTVNEMRVYVREYGGFSLSHDDAEKEYEQLKSDLDYEGLDDHDRNLFYVVGYNSPFTLVNRKNEIWIPIS